MEFTYIIHGNKDCSDNWRLKAVPYFVKMQKYVGLFSEILINEFS